MLTVRITDFHIGEVFEKVLDLRKRGYLQGIDFDFKYCPEKYETTDGVREERAVEFMFYDESLGLLFKLGNKS
jgi:hypothetical protein